MYDDYHVYVCVASRSHLGRASIPEMTYEEEDVDDDDNNDEE